jgi:hypothetical protein
MSLPLNNGRLNLKFDELLFYTEVLITILVIIYALQIERYVVSTSIASGIVMKLYKTL